MHVKVLHSATAQRQHTSEHVCLSLHHRPIDTHSMAFARFDKVHKATWHTAQHLRLGSLWEPLVPMLCKGTVVDSKWVSVVVMVVSSNANIACL